MNSTHFLMVLSSKLILASGSPRRKQLLLSVGFKFEIKTIPFEEVFPNDLDIREVPEYLAKEKNNAHRKAFGTAIILTADTSVICNEKILGKPVSNEEAIQMLRFLSGKVHEVITGVCISSVEKNRSFSMTTEVKFRKLTEKEIKHYISNYKPMDKAGSYAIQEWIGLIGVEWIKGSFYNVMGLPINQVYKILNEEFQYEAF